jgi:hypothetical protein
MRKTALLISITFLFSACANQHGISAKYYSDCEEYYDMQGYYHKECGKDDIVMYSEIRDSAGNLVDSAGNVVNSVKESAQEAVDFLLNKKSTPTITKKQQENNPRNGSVW